jgi:hypothetical protein
MAYSQVRRRPTNHRVVSRELRTCLKLAIAIDPTAGSKDKITALLVLLDCPVHLSLVNIKGTLSE